MKRMKKYTLTVNRFEIDIKFPWDKNGNVCIDEGTYNYKKNNILSVKYVDELYICFGVSSAEHLDDTREVVRV